MIKLRKTTEDFVKKAIRIHGNKYGYSAVIYKNNYTKIEIKCYNHGNFFQRPNSHLRGSGCRKCFLEKCSKSFKSTTKSFMKKAIKIHGEEYGYSKTKYITGRVKIEIICYKHGSFWQRPDAHLKGSGCSKCHNSFSTTNKFVEKALIIHKKKYDYSKAVYINARTKIEIICPKHGSFWQAPNYHLNGRGCQKCACIISRPEINWLNDNGVPDKYKQFKIKIGKKLYKVDAFNPKINTIYEFLGDYWHGNPNKYEPNDINKKVKKTFGILYKETIERIKIFEKNGYNVKYIWESDFCGKA